MSCYLKLLAVWLFIQLFVHANIKENIQAYVTGPLWRKSNTEQWIPLSKGQ